MPLPVPFDPPPNTPLIKDASVWSQWSRWFWQIYKRIKDGALGGTVTSVGLSLPTSVFDVTGSPVTGAGTLTATFDNQNANTVFAGPTMAPAATPAFRALVVADLPAGTGTVTSITVNGTGTFLLSTGSPITTSGTITLNPGPDLFAFSAAYG
jgi:hypothetical protein